MSSVELFLNYSSCASNSFRSPIKTVYFYCFFFFVFDILFVFFSVRHYNILSINLAFIFHFLFRNIIRRLEPPVLSIQPQNQTVPQGTTVAIRCFSTSDPDAPIEWSKSNEQLPTHVQVLHCFYHYCYYYMKCIMFDLNWHVFLFGLRHAVCLLPFDDV